MRIDWANVGLRIITAGRASWMRGYRVSPNGDVRRYALWQNNLWLVREGHGAIATQGGRVELRPGTCLWCRGKWSYWTEQDPDDPILHDFVNFEMLDAGGRGKLLCNRMNMPPELLHPFDVHLTGEMVSRVVELAKGLNTVGVDLYPEAARTAHAMLKVILMELDASCDMDRSADDLTELDHRRRIHKAASSIALAPQDVPPIAEIADQAGYSHDHFTRVFRQIMGQTPKQYALDARIEHAKQMLRSSDLSCKEIARLVGYQDLKYFSRQFKVRVGKTLTEYRHHREA